MSFTPTVETFPGKVWRILPDREGSSLLVEVRNETDQAVLFYYLDIQQKNVQVLDWVIATWWTGIEALHDGFVVLHDYDKEIPGRHLGISVYHATNRSIAWKKPGLRFLGVQNNILWAETDQGSMGLRLATGEPVSWSIEASIHQQVIRQTMYPFLYLQDDAHFPVVSLFISERYGQITVKSIEYLEAEGYVFISYYIYNEAHKGLTNWLKVFDAGNGDQKASFLLHNEATGIGQGAFMLHYRYLIFQQGQNSIGFCYV